MLSRDGLGGAGDDLVGGAAWLGSERENAPGQGPACGDDLGKAQAGDRAREARLRPGHGYAGDRWVKGGGIGGEAVLADQVEPGLELVALAGEGRLRGCGRYARGGGKDGFGCSLVHRGGDLGRVRVRLAWQQRVEPAGVELDGDGVPGSGRVERGPRGKAWR